MNLSALLLACHLLGATSVWVEEPSSNTSPTSEPPRSGARDHRLYAARGEYESFQIFFRTDEIFDANLTVEVKTQKSDVPPPTIYQVGYVSESEQSASPSSVKAGPLYPLSEEGIAVEPDTTYALWLTYYVPEYAQPGESRHTILLKFGKQVQKKVRVRLEVFGFTLPPTSSLDTLFTLDRAAVRSRYEIGNVDFESWKPIYDSIAKYRISYRVWTANAPPVTGANRVDEDTIRQHLAFAAQAGSMGVVDVSPSRNSNRFFPKPEGFDTRDSLTDYLERAAGWFPDTGAERVLVYEPQSPGPRATWESTRMAYLRARFSSSEVGRLLRAPLHPFFEGVAEVWVAPLFSLHPQAVRQLQQGHSLTTEEKSAPATLLTSSNGSNPLLGGLPSAPEDLYDGSLFSGWFSKAFGSLSDRHWVRLDFAEPVTPSVVRLAWTPGHEARTVKLFVSRDGQTFPSARTSWKTQFGEFTDEFSWTKGTLEYPKSVRAIRLEFAPQAKEVPIGLLEVSLSTYGFDEAPKLEHPTKVWLDVSSDLPASLGEVPGVSLFRLLPWICHQRGLDGIAGGSLNSWPTMWRAEALDAASILTIPGGPELLLYPSAKGMNPSAQLMQLRDGLEDYEYMRLIEKASESTTRKNANFASRSLSLDMSLADAVPSLATRLAEWRIAVGRALTRQGDR